jgi:serine protease Do
MRIVKRYAPLCITVLLSALTVATAGCNLIQISVPSQSTSPATTPAAPLQPSFTLPVVGGTQSMPLPSIADVVARVKPAVVAINVEVPQADIFGRTYTEQGAGSGWIIDSNGIVVTNNHVVEGASKITVVLDDGRTFDAGQDSIATDPLSDLAVIKIKATGLPAATIGDSSKLRVGDWVVAIGNSLGQGIRATVGIVSQQSVSIDVNNQTLTGLIETDAAINPGNSGGPLVNMSGQVIGIDSVKIAEVGVEGVGYAIGMVEAAPIIQQLVSAGYVTRPYLGVRMDSVNPTYITRYNLGVQQGAILLEVVAGGPAEAAGLKTGDVITAFGGKTVTDPTTLRQALHQRKIGDTVELTYQRGREQLKTQVLLAATPKQ